MKIKENFADRFAEHDKRLMEAHIKKEKNSLKKESRRLEDLKDVPLMYYPYEEELGAGVDPGVLYQLNGWWEIRA